VSVIIPVSGIKYSKDPVKMKVGETYTPSFSFIPDDATNTAMVFETSDAAVATVERYGHCPRGRKCKDYRNHCRRKQ